MSESSELSLPDFCFLQPRILNAYASANLRYIRRHTYL